MRDAKRKKLEAAGWRVGSADALLGLSEAESRQVDAALGPAASGAVEKLQSDKKLTAGSSLADLRIPDGWRLEPLDRLPDYALLTTPRSSTSYMATIDFGRRGVRSGYSTSGRFVGEEWNNRRKKYGGRGWRQQIVDDAVAHLQEVIG